MKKAIVQALGWLTGAAAATCAFWALPDPGRASGGARVRLSSASFSWLLLAVFSLSPFLAMYGMEYGIALSCSLCASACDHLTVRATII